MWVVDIIENCITLWNSTLSSIWSMLTQSPETFHNGAVWNAITKIFTALQGAGYGLLFGAGIDPQMDDLKVGSEHALAS